MKHLKLALAAFIAMALALNSGVASAAMKMQENDGSDSGIVENLTLGSGLSLSGFGADRTLDIVLPSVDTLTFTTNAESIDNATDDTVQISSDTEAIIVKALGFEAKDASLVLSADQSDDNGDDWKLVSNQSGNALSVQNDASGALVTKISVATTGVITQTVIEATDASITLQTDDSDDNGDDWKIASVASGNAFTIANDTSGSMVNKISIAAADGDITSTGGFAGDGGDTIVGLLNSTVTSTTTSLTIAQCGATIVNDSADVLTLPEASTAIGCRYTFMTNNASNFDVNPADASDTITLLTNAAGDAIRNATVGNFVCLQAVDATNWSQCGILGTWSDIN